jgi:hypothetical protein
MFATIMFANMCARDLSRSSLSIQKTRLLTHSLKIWHKMTSNVITATWVASNLPQPPMWGSVTYVTSLEYFGTYFGYLPMSPTSQHSDTFQLIPDQSQLDPKYSKTPYIAELVFFFLEILRIRSCIKNAPVWYDWNITFSLGISSLISISLNC